MHAARKTKPKELYYGKTRFCIKIKHFNCFWGYVINHNHCNSKYTNDRPFEALSVIIITALGSQGWHGYSGLGAFIHDKWIVFKC